VFRQINPVHVKYLCHKLQINRCTTYKHSVGGGGIYMAEGVTYNIIFQCQFKYFYMMVQDLMLN
jgi:hypothetical protein